VKKQRKCVHSTLSKTKRFRARALKLLTRMGKQMGLSPKLVADLRALPDILESMSHGPEWEGFRRAAKLIVDKWGFEVGVTLLRSVKLLSACLKVELGCAEKAYLREQSRTLMKTIAASKRKVDATAALAVEQELKEYYDSRQREKKVRS